MTPFEVGAMLSLARRYDSRRPPLTADEARDWYTLFVAQGIGGSGHEDLTDAVKDHYGRTRDWLMPYDVVAYCKRVRAERLRAAVPVAQLIQADPENVAAWHAERKQLTDDIASGRRDAKGQIVTPQPPRLEAL